MNDEEIIRLVISGDKESYRHLIERYQLLVFRTCMGFVHNKEDAEDLTQESFIQAYQSLSSFQRKSSFKTWLVRIAINTSLNFLRKKNQLNIFSIFNQTQKSADTEKFESAQWIENINPENILIDNQTREILKEALDSLPEKQRIAIVLSKYDNLSQKEIAQVLNTSEGAVEALIQRAKTNLRKKLSNNL